MSRLQTLAKAWFIDHPQSVDETYLQHLRSAWSFASRLVAAGIACWIHGILPKLFTTTGSRTVALLHRRMVLDRARDAVVNDVKGNLPRQVRR